MSAQYLFRDGVDSRISTLARKRRMGLCVAHDCFNPCSRGGGQQRWCNYHLTIWDTARLNYEYLRVSATCVYCRTQPAALKKVNCEACEDRHKYRVEECVEQHRKRLASWAFSPQEYYKRRLWLSCGLPAEFLKEEGYGWDVPLSVPS